MGMKQILVMLAAAVVLVGQSVVADEKPIADPIVERAIRFSLDKPEGKLTEADLAKVTYLNLINAKITDKGLKELAKLQKLKVLNLSQTKITDEGLKEEAKWQQLERLSLEITQVTEAGVGKLQTALPNCEITGP